WPGTRPDNTSKYIIVGALIDGESVRTTGMIVANSTLAIYLRGIGFTDCTYYGMQIQNCVYVELQCIGVYNSGFTGILLTTCFGFVGYRLGLVKNNTNSDANHAGIAFKAVQNGLISSSGLSDNEDQGVLVS
ncbi:unnamed protein product, partial [marine sediment metagenome]